MKRKAVLAVLAVMLAFAAAPSVMAGFSFGISANATGVQNFYMAVGDYNRVQERDVMVVRQEGIPDEELPVVFFIAGKANVPYGEIVKLRLMRWGWWKIALKYRLDPEVFYVPVNGEVSGKVYGRSYKYYKMPRKNWKKISLTDVDIVNNVNLRFVSENYGHNPAEIIKMREEGRNFVTINENVYNMHVKEKTWKEKHKRYDKARWDRFEKENKGYMHGNEQHGNDKQWGNGNAGNQQWNKDKGANPGYGNNGNDKQVGNSGSGKENYKDLDDKDQGKHGHNK